MIRRPKGFSPIDPLSLPLPHGTEVTTRVDRVIEDRRIPRGAVGRVARLLPDNAVEVQVTGFGPVVYAREELLPRRPGQVLFAERREAAWEALRPCAILEATVGSRAWGLAGEGSDCDQRGILAVPFGWRLGLVSPPDCIVTADGSATFWDYPKALHQAMRADPNTLELLFVSTARPLDPAGEWILDARDAFVSAEIFGSFGRYAMSQLSKLSASQRLAEHRGQVLDWLKAEPVPDLDEVARRLAAISPRKARTREDALYGAKEYIKQLYRSLHDQGLIAACDFASLVDYARGGGRQPEPARELRPKNAYNLLRLIFVATQWLEIGRPQLEMQGAVRERLLAIKLGQVPLDEVLREAEGMVPALEAARNNTRLPKRPDVPRIDALLRRLNEEFARRHLSNAPGLWGTDAPVPPTPPIEEEETR